MFFLYNVGFLKNYSSVAWNSLTKIQPDNYFSNKQINFLWVVGRYCISEFEILSGGDQYIKIFYLFRRLNL